VVEREAAGGDGVDGDRRGIAHLHDGALAELLLDLLHREVERLALGVVRDVLVVFRHGRGSVAWAGGSAGARAASGYGCAAVTAVSLRRRARVLLPYRHA